MKLIIGLGNPGNKYQETRHNIGFMVIDKIATNFQFSIFNFKLIFNAEISEKILKDEKIILVKPQTFMNNSGHTVKTIIDYYKIPIKDIIVIHDDIDLDLGEIKMQQDRSSAGHNGVQSIIDSIGTKDFTRIRIGIKPINKEISIDTEKFVLQKFTKEEEIVQKTIEKAAALVVAAL